MSYAASILGMIEQLEQHAGSAESLRAEFETQVQALFATVVGDTADAPQPLVDANTLINRAVADSFEGLTSALLQGAELLREYIGNIQSTASL